MMARLEIPVNGKTAALVSEVDETWQCTPDVDLDLVARAVNTAGYGERQRKKHIAERRAYFRVKTLHQEVELTE
jgi:hypothetical protein